MVAPTYDALKLPEGVKTVLITGAGGFVGQQLTHLLLKLFPSLRIITTDVVQPPKLIDDAQRLRVVKADLGDVEQVKGLFEGEEVGGVYALHGIMSGGAEANFELGWAVNVDSNVNLLKATHAHAKQKGTKPVFVFVSSLAVYGGPKCLPESYVVPKRAGSLSIGSSAYGRDTPVLAQSSYGVQKQISELYVYDWGRKGYLDTRSVRLPTVAIRSGAPSSAASSFISGLIREPLQGQPSVCPIASSIDDPILDNMPVYLSRTSTVVRNIAYALCMPESKFVPGMGRSINLPGIKITPRDILNALVEHGGKDKLDLVSFEKDQAVINICKTWAGDYDSSDAQAMGFEVDDVATGFGLAVKDFKAELQA